MRTRITAILASFGVLLAILVGVPAATGQSAALANGETFKNSYSSSASTQVKVISSSGKVSYIGVLPNGQITSTARLHSWYLPAGRCAMFSVDGVYQPTRKGSSYNSWVWIPFGSRVSAHIWRC